MTGHIRRRGAQSWELKFDAGRDEKTGRRTTQFHSFRGTKKEAQFKLAGFHHFGRQGLLCRTIDLNRCRACACAHRPMGRPRKNHA